MSSESFHEKPRQKAKERLTDDLLKARAERLKRATRSANEDPLKVREKFDALSKELHRIQDASEREDLSPYEQLARAAVDAFEETLKGIEASLQKNRTHLLQDDDWEPYLDGIMERSVQMAPEGALDSSAFRAKLLAHPRIVEIFESLNRISKEHQHEQMADATAHELEKLRMSVGDVGFMYKSSQEIRDGLLDSIESVAVHIGIDPVAAREEYTNAMTHVATEAMKAHQKTVLENALRAIFEQDTKLDDPDHIEDRMRYIVEKQGWTDFDFPSEYASFVQSNTFFENFKDRFLNEVPNTLLRVQVEQLLAPQPVVRLVHELRENLEIYMHAFSEQQMKQLAFLVGVRLDRSMAEYQTREEFEQITDVITDEELLYKKMFGEEVSREQFLDDLRMIMDWEGSFDSVVERLSWQAIRPYYDWVDENKRRQVIPAQGVHDRIIGAAIRSKFTNIHQLLTSRKGYAVAMKNSRSNAYKTTHTVNYDPQGAHSKNKSEQNNLNKIRQGKLGEWTHGDISDFNDAVKVYLEMEIDMIVRALSKDSELPNKMAPLESLDALLAPLRFTRKNLRSDYYQSKVTSLQANFIEHVTKRKARREQAGIASSSW